MPAGGRPGRSASVSRRLQTGGSTSATITPASSHRFYLVVALTGEEEGSYGQAGDGTERSPDPGACLPQRIGGCP
ncbi:MAG: hypothetical protein Q9Q13_05235 [Acidobacteriota bacterium]|nr:hypothetical protein [Acidobacteriota bacterium]